MILSEFVNRFERIAFNIYKDSNNINFNFDFKRNYKNTKNYKENNNSIFNIINNQILKIMSMINIEYQNDTIKSILSNYNNDKIDFNDTHIERICLKNDFLLLTNAGDFSSSNIKIISDNRNYFT